MLNRGIINEAAFYLLIEQSDARLAWGPFLLQLRRMLLTPHEYAELYIRGWISQQEMYDGTALHGLTQADTDLRQLRRAYDELNRIINSPEYLPANLSE